MKNKTNFQRFNRLFRPSPLSKTQRAKRLERIANRIAGMTDEERQDLKIKNPDIKDVIEGVEILIKES